MKHDDNSDTVAQVSLGGHVNDSTRAESFGALVSIARPGPVNVGIDSSSCLDAVDQLHEMAKHATAHDLGNYNRVRVLQKHGAKVT